MVFAALMVGFAGYLVSLQFTVGASVSGRLCTGAASLIALLMAAGILWYALQRFQVGVDRDGWTVRIGRYRRDLRWAEISAVVIENREIEGRGRRVVPALYLVPEPGVSLDAPSDLRATVDDRPAVRLFDLTEPKIEEKQFVRDLASLAGDRLPPKLARLSRRGAGPAAVVPPAGLHVAGAERPEPGDVVRGRWWCAARCGRCTRRRWLRPDETPALVGCGESDGIDCRTRLETIP